MDGLETFLLSKLGLHKEVVSFNLIIDMDPRPQLKLKLVRGEKTKPPAPEAPGFPLEASSNKIVVVAEFSQIFLRDS